MSGSVLSGGVRDEVGPGGGGEGEPGAGFGVRLGVADVDGVGEGYGHLDAVVAGSAAVAALEPDQLGRTHRSPRIRRNRLTESWMVRACERILTYRCLR